MISDERNLIAAFELLYGHYPEPATLVHRSKRIVVANIAAQKMN